MKKQIKRFFGVRFGPSIAYVLIHILFWTCKKNFIISDKIQEVLHRPILVVFWHGEMLFQPFLYAKIRQKPNGRVIISHHSDGEIAARTIKFFGLKAIRGSTSRGAIRVLMNAFKFLREGEDLAITPDGPRGPYHNIADGIIAMAQKSGAPIVIFRFFGDNLWRLNSWDRFMIPKPFSKVYCMASEPISIQGLSLAEAKAFLKEKMETHF